jgi:hypothetical protein
MFVIFCVYTIILRFVMQAFCVFTWIMCCFGVALNLDSYLLEVSNSLNHQKLV